MLFELPLILRISSNLFSTEIGEHLLAGAARSSNIEIIKWATKSSAKPHLPCEFAYEKQTCVLSKLVHSKASKSGNLKILKWLNKKDCPYHFEDSLCMAAASGDEKVVDWILKTSNQLLLKKPCVAAAEAGHFELAKKLYVQHNSYKMEEAAAKHGNIEFLEWLVTAGQKLSISTCGLQALKYGQLEVAEWLKARGWILGDRAGVAAAESGKLTLLQWVKDNGGTWNFSTMTTAAIKGDLEMVKWLRENGSPWNRSTSLEVAYHGKFEIFKWLIENSCPYGIQTDEEEEGSWTITAPELVKGRRIDVLKYLMSYGIYLSADCYCHTESVALFETLYQLGCPLSAKVWDYAIEHDNMSTLEWLKTKNCPWNPSITLSSLRTEKLEWITQNGFEKGLAATEYAAKKYNLKDLKQLVRNGWPWDTDTTKAAAIYRNVDSFKWLVKSGCPVDLDECEKVTRSEDIKAFINKRRSKSINKEIKLYS